MPLTVAQLLLSRSEQDSTALAFEDRTWSWREYVAASTARAHALRNMLDPQAPRHVGLLLENTPEMVLGLAAGALGGYVTVGINTTRRGTALSADIRKADCQVVLTDAKCSGLLKNLELDGIRVINTDSDSWQAEVERRREAAPLVAPEATDVFMLIFTSGTSGSPKAVMVTDATVVAAGESLAQRFSLTSDDVCYVSMPLFHSNAVMSGFAVALSSGATMALARRFSASSFLRDIRRYGATYMNYVGKPLAYILATPRMPDDADNPLRYAFGNEASERDVVEFRERFGCEVRDGFGSTEMAIVIRRVPGTPPGSIGQPPPEVAVFDRDTNTECPTARFDAAGRVVNLAEAVGELVNLHGAGDFRGYYNDPEATEQRLSGGIYWSGDLGYRDENGFVYLAGRSGVWLRVDGENLAAVPIERIVLRHPAVNQVAVYGIPDPNVGDQLMAAVVLGQESGLSPAEFERFLRVQQDLSPKAWPRFVRIVDTLPATATNKILKRVLIDEGTNTSDTIWMRAGRGTSYDVRPV
ncbi:AMP-binding protein [Antrihabitans sp. YC2-6]|uniref:AMP-binding protein n=1 Tax=Antrihabitans sp. YC2-6 TaxID=2799498 RepID=UPI0018F5B91A|nr:AMP-binding protein [Antrihabitans sp. YC2-6]MBJ8345777.1 AMP-binding protein [Antrihabitans sp. YC2-6]